MDLPKGGREYVYWPIWSEATLTAVDIRAGCSNWVPMEAVSGYVPVLPTAPDAQWWRALVAGPQATGNPAGTLVLSETSAATFRINHEPEIIIRSGGLIRLTG